MIKAFFILTLLTIIFQKNTAFAGQANIFGEDPYYSTMKYNIPYFNDLEMEKIYTYYPNVTKTTAKVLILDNAFYPNHQDYGINGEVDPVKYYDTDNGKRTSHGTSVQELLHPKLVTI